MIFLNFYLPIKGIFLKNGEMDMKKWNDYANYLSTYNRKTDRVLQHFPLKMIPQIREDRRDLREIIELSLLRERILDSLGTLSEREQQVLILRFGLDRGFSRTLRSVSRFIGVCSDRVRQIQNKALRKLRHPSRMKILLEPEEYKMKMKTLQEEERKRLAIINQKYNWLWD